MKSTYFHLSNPEFHSEAMREGYDRRWATYRVPILPAYAMISYSIQGVRANVDEVTNAIESSILMDEVIIYGIDELLSRVQPSEPILAVNYLGVRSYPCFFPHFGDPDLKARCAQFMEEADQTFEESSWLSFVLMAGGVFEGFLVDLTGNQKATFGQLIAGVEQTDVFDDLELQALRDAAEARNLVHAGRAKDPYVTRERLMDIRLALEQFLRKDWRRIKSDYQIRIESEEPPN